MYKIIIGRKIYATTWDKSIFKLGKGYKDSKTMEAVIRTRIHPSIMLKLVKSLILTTI